MRARLYRTVHVHSDGAVCLCPQKHRCDYLHVITAWMCGTCCRMHYLFFLPVSRVPPLSLHLPSIFLDLSIFFYSVLLSRPSSSPHSSPRNWPVKHSRRDQRHFTKSTMTQPTQLLAHQKAVVAALTMPTVMWRQVSTVCATTRTQAALDITTRAIYTCQRGAASRDEGQTDTAGSFTCHHVQSVLFCH